LVRFLLVLFYLEEKMSKKIRGIARFTNLFILLIIIFISSVFLLSSSSGLQAEKAKTENQEVVNVGVPQEDPEKTNLLEQLKFYRRIGNREKADEILRLLTLFSNSNNPDIIAKHANLGTNIISAIIPILPTDLSKPKELIPAKDIYVQWMPNDIPIMYTGNNEKHPWIDGFREDANKLYLVAEFYSGGASYLRIARSENKGSSWPTSLFYTFDTASNFTLPKIKRIASNYLGVVGTAISGTRPGVLFVKIKANDFYDVYANWIDIVISDSSNIERPAITSDYDYFPQVPYIYCVYFYRSFYNNQYNYYLTFTRSTDYGNSWEARRTIDSFSSYYPIDSYCSIAFVDDRLYVAYTKLGSSGDSDIILAWSDDLGLTWSNTNRRSIATITRNERYPQIAAIDKNNAIVVYEYELGSNNRDILYAYTTDGNAWYLYQTLAASTNDERFPNIAAQPGGSEYYISYPDFSNNQIRVYKIPKNSPTTKINLGNIKNSSSILGDDVPAVLANQDGVGVAWVEQHGDWDIYFDASWLTPAELDVIPSEDFNSSGPIGGPFNPPSMQYTLQNIGGQALNWTVGVNQNWVSLSPTSGTLNPGASTTVTVSINSNANSLPAGSYSATVTFTNTTNGQGNTTRSVNLTVVPPPNLSVTPADGLSSSGPVGGPFTPSSKSYTLQNIGGQALNWTVGVNQNWVSLSPTSGTLNPGASTTVTVSINSNANSLPAGSYSATVTFTNTTNGQGNTTRSVNLTVQPVNYPDINLPSSKVAFGYKKVGSSTELMLVIENKGNAVLNISSINRSSGSSDFSVIDYTPSIAGSSSGYARLRFNPASTGPKEAVFSIVSNDPDEPSVSFTAIGNGLNFDYFVFAGHNFDGAGGSDISVWRPSDGVWYVRSVMSQQWGQSGDIPVNGDYNGDGTTDVAVWRPSNGMWYVRGQFMRQWGTFEDIPVPADYDGDGKIDLAVWRPSEGMWYIQYAGGGVIAIAWGVNGDLPIPGDFDGDNKADIVVWRPSNGTWYVRGQFASSWGTNEDIPVRADYNGDGKSDIAVWRPSNGVWYIQHSGGGYALQYWGTAEDIPVPGDYNGNKVADIAVWRPSTGMWYIYNIGAYQWGTSGDIPLVR